MVASGRDTPGVSRATLAIERPTGICRASSWTSTVMPMSVRAKSWVWRVPVTTTSSTVPLCRVKVKDEPPGATLIRWPVRPGRSWAETSAV
ncbi:hypothetical protein [Phenylobacterium sp. J367]|uniref:hypothetical protein n=1 Tax=Phenylobacterium sp. J367 TaxID=2898435 RepID=UPI0021510C5F|nr:hypothetical protein [Phenylobacterium sp. J367]MCR5878710.1 hypothetical protein [Phenylobacterium sp. J367]